MRSYIILLLLSCISVTDTTKIRNFLPHVYMKSNFVLEIKKQTQELYGLINYGEFRKKMGCVTEKTSLKLNELVITGFTHLRLKGKNVHIRTPRCRALRRLNQLEGTGK